MLLLILSDIHSNLEALNAVLEDAKQYSYEKIACCGDLVGYGPNPNEVCEWAINEKNKDGIFVMGNHDMDISNNSSTFEYNPSARAVIEFQRKIVSEQNKIFLKSLLLRQVFENILFIHGSPSYWCDYILDSCDASSNIKYMKNDICFIGHTHRSAIWFDDKPKIINVGSVGQPRDGDARACYVIFNTKTREVITRRCEYDIVAVQDKMRKINMPNKLIDRLTKGE